MKRILISFIALTSLCHARDLTDEEIDNAENGPGSGYHYAQDAAEDAPQYKSATCDIYQMDDGTVIIIDIDSDEVYVIKAS